MKSSTKSGKPGRVGGRCNAAALPFQGPAEPLRRVAATALAPNNRACDSELMALGISGVDRVTHQAQIPSAKRSLLHRRTRRLISGGAALRSTLLTPPMPPAITREV